MTNHQNRWQRIGERVVQRRTELGLHERAELIQISGVSEPTVRHLEQGDPRGNPSARIKARIAFGLRWMPDAIDQLLKGRQPEDLYDAAGRLEAAGANAQLKQIQAQIADWEFRRRALDPSDAPPDDITQRLERIEELVELLVQGQDRGIAAVLKRIDDLAPPTRRRAAR